MSKHYLLFILLVSGCLVVNAQSIERLSKADSALFNKYHDSAFHTSLSSPLHQRYLDSALMVSPHDAYMWQQKAMPLYKQKKYEAGEPFLDSAVKYDPSHWLDYRAFMKCIFQKSMHDAISDFHASKQIIGNGVVMDHTYDFYLGLCYLQLNILDSAAFYFTKTTGEQKKARGEDNVHFLDLFYLGIVYYEKEDYIEAIKAFDRALKRYPHFSDVKYYKAICLQKLGINAEALEVIKEGEQDFNAGYTINEDNAVYEAYPYQVTKAGYYKGVVKYLEAKK
jgi:tetratricopeptide (TPR) repeat protein